MYNTAAVDAFRILLQRPAVVPHIEFWHLELLCEVVVQSLNHRILVAQRRAGAHVPQAQTAREVVESHPVSPST